jgi:hypothetical protein
MDLLIIICFAFINFMTNSKTQQTESLTKKRYRYMQFELFELFDRLYLVLGTVELISVIQ